MSNIPTTDESLSEGFAWRVAGFFVGDDRAPTLEVSPELDKMFDPDVYVPGIGESLIELGVMLLKYANQAFEDYDVEEKPRRPSPKPRPAAKPSEVRRGINGRPQLTNSQAEDPKSSTGFYL